MRMLQKGTLNNETLRASVVLMVMVMALAAVSGCREKKEPPPPPTPIASGDAVQQMRQSYQKADPGARVGVVTISRPDLNLGAVGAVATADFKDGDVINFMDGDQNMIAHGTVANKTASALHVRVDTAQDYRRFPQVGDIAIRVSSGVSE